MNTIDQLSDLVDDILALPQPRTGTSALTIAHIMRDIIDNGKTRTHVISD